MKMRCVKEAWNLMVGNVYDCEKVKIDKHIAYRCINDDINLYDYSEEMFEPYGEYTIDEYNIKMRCVKEAYRLTPGKEYECKKIVASDGQIYYECMSDIGLFYVYPAEMFEPYEEEKDNSKENITITKDQYDEIMNTLYSAKHPMIHFSENIEEMEEEADKVHYESLAKLEKLLVGLKK